MTTKIYYNKSDDVFTIYEDKFKPSETIEFSEFLNIDINKNKCVVGLEIFYASEFFSAINKIFTKTFLESVKDVFVKCNQYRNNWFIVLVFNCDGKKIKIQLPPLRKSEYTSPLIASGQ